MRRVGWSSPERRATCVRAAKGNRCKRSRTRVCYDSDDHRIACPSQWNKRNIIIVSIIVGLALLLMIAGYVRNRRREHRSRAWMKPLQARIGTLSGVGPSYNSVPQKDTRLPPYDVSDSATTLAAPPPAYTPPHYKL
jgi:hypothetical protein